MQTLVSASTIGTQPDISDAQLADAVKAELAAWFGVEETAAWQLLRIYRIPFAQPNQVLPQHQPLPCISPNPMTLSFECLGMTIWGLAEVLPVFAALLTARIFAK